MTLWPSSWATTNASSRSSAAKRIIPCLDVTGGRVVKGVNFVELRDAGDPVEIAARYNEQGADELTFLDITATSDDRDLILHIVEAVAAQVFIPLTVGGGVRSVADVRRLLNAGADKVSFNSAAVANPQVIKDASAKYGAQCIVVAIDAKRRVQAKADASGRPGDDGAVPVVGVFEMNLVDTVLIGTQRREAAVALQSDAGQRIHHDVGRERRIGMGLAGCDVVGCGRQEVHAAIVTRPRWVRRSPAAGQADRRAGSA